LIEVATIGFTKSNAENFFERLLKAGVRKVIDVRLHNTSQLSGFAKSDDLKYLLEKVGNIRYVHSPLLAPTDEMQRRVDSLQQSLDLPSGLPMRTR
jgi:uncharacterized protein (DUF488 family)